MHNQNKQHFSNKKKSTIIFQIKADRQRRKYPAWWPFQDISPAFFGFTIIWPVVVAFVFRAMQQKRLNHGVGKRS